MRVIPVRDWHEASQRIGAYPFSAQSLDEAIERMKRKWPGKTPHTCYWHKVTENVNKYYFVTQKEAHDDDLQRPA